MPHQKLFYTAPLSLLVVGGASFAGIKFVSGLNNSSYPISLKEIEEKAKKHKKHLKIPELGNQNPTLKISNPIVVNSNNQISQINVSSSEELKIISEIPENFLSFDTEIDSKDYESPKNSVSQIFEEIKREVETKKIDEEMKQKIDSVKKELESSFEKFQKASKKIKSWEGSMKLLENIDFSQGIKSITRTQKTEVVETLNKEDRKVLINFYEKFFELVGEKKKLTENLTKLTKNQLQEVQKIKEMNDNSKEILRDLKEIGWENDEDLKVRVNHLLKGTSLKIKNPFSHFLSEQEWEIFKGYAADIKRSELEVEGNSWIRMFCIVGTTPIWWDPEVCFGSLAQLRKKKDFVVYSLDWKIGSKLLYDMQQADKVIDLLSDNFSKKIAKKLTSFFRDC